ncbi:DEAD/DEAH box helicase [Devosia sp. Leaf420]|uniref:DEAD/DEAH box helicase n=1 Tax=Devosia sp. Leaf420 TaxID=1736374 RepID=UPI000785698D|nr:DEAD/DEAH box helicase family protein [Devosia sp. Leaf420]
MSRHLVEALARAGVEELTAFAGRDAVELLSKVESKALNASALAEVVVRRLGGSEVLRQKGLRSTLLTSLRVPEAKLLASLLGLESEDPYASLLEFEFDRSVVAMETLHAHFGVPIVAQEEVAELPDSIRTQGPYTLFSHQRRASQAVQRILTGDFARVLLHMPTGAGKTRTAVTTIVDLLRSLEDGEVVVWLAHSEELCDQAFEEFVKAWSYLGSRPLRVHRHYGSHRIPDLSTVDDGIIVAGLSLLYQQSASRQSEFLALARRVRLIVMDEAHQATAPTYSHLIDLLQRRKDAGVLGLSATPGRSLKDVGADIALAEFFRGNRVKLEVDGYRDAIQYLTEQGYLARMEFVQLPFGQADVELSASELKRLQEGFDLPARVIAELADDEARNLMIVDVVKREVEAGGSVILFALSVDHANMLASVLAFMGVAAASVTGSTPAEQRRQTIQRYKDRAGIDVLCNYGVLTTGFDAPRTNVAVIARPTTSVVLYSQMIGRAARGSAAGGNEECRILTVVDRVPGFASLVEGFQFWDDIWEDEHNG